MHIPDGYLSLQTTIPALGVMASVWSVAFKKVKNVLNMRQIPLLSLCAAFSFVIMMFNVPLGQSSVHAVGAVFIAILLGPWAACIAVSVALIIQAVIFGDGGILSIGINCFNMAVAMPFVGYYIYKLIAGKSELASKRSIAGICMGSYIGINLAAFLAALEFGIQPMLFKTAEGIPQYGFYPLSVSIPAMMLEHLIAAGPIEAITTAAAVTYVAKFAPHLLKRISPVSPAGERKSFFVTYRPLLVGLAILTVLTPIGLIATGTAWGEWGTDQIKAMVGYVPSGLEKFSKTWSAMIPDYTILGLDRNFFQSSIGYIISAAAGIILIAAVMLLTGKLVVKRDE